MYKREILTLQIGGAGNRIGHAFYEQIASEHGIELSQTGHPRLNPGNDLLMNVGVFFDENRHGAYTPRSICCDCDISDLSESLDLYRLKNVYPRQNIIGGRESSANCYARAFHVEGLPVANQAISTLRREVEKCDSIQGLRMLHSIAGGSGSGLTGLLLRSAKDIVGEKCLVYSACIVPSPTSSETVLSIYNSVLSLSDLIEFAHMVLPYDNQAIHKQILEAATMGYSANNRYIAECLSGITSSLRFPGLINADLRKIHSNCVLYKNAHFLTSSFAKDMKTVYDHTAHVTRHESSTVSYHHSDEGTCNMSTFLAYRGASINASEVHDAIEKILRFNDGKFPKWNPNSVSASICSQPPPKNGSRSLGLTCVGNNTAIHQFFDRITTLFNAQFKAKSHIYLYEESGIHQDELTEALEVVRSVSGIYRECSRETETRSRDPIMNDHERGIINEISQCIVYTCLSLVSFFTLRYRYESFLQENRYLWRTGSFCSRGRG
jgi:tubulin beta